jgi:thioredoxin-like negative regulator of GroEL
LGFFGGLAMLNIIDNVGQEGASKMRNFGDLLIYDRVVLACYFSYHDPVAKEIKANLFKIGEEWYRHNLSVIQINSDTFELFAKKFKIKKCVDRIVPTWLLFVDGTVKMRLTGIQSKSQLSHLVERFL